jgi:hypothetical protein
LAVIYLADTENAIACESGRAVAYAKALVKTRLVSSTSISCPIYISLLAVTIKRSVRSVLAALLAPSNRDGIHFRLALCHRPPRAATGAVAYDISGNGEAFAARVP